MQSGRKVTDMRKERKQILQMLAEGKITADEADKLLDALGEEQVSGPAADAPSGERGGKPKFLYIQVTSSKDSLDGRENVNIKIPIFLLKAGLKLGALVPGKAQAKLTARLGDLGLDMDNLDAEKVDIFTKALMEGQINVVSDKEVVNIFCK